MKMEANKMHIRHCMLFLFNLKKTAAEATELICTAYGENAIGESTCRLWFSKFRRGEFSLEDKPRSGRPHEMQTEELQALLDKNSAQSSHELAVQLGVNHKTILNRLHAMGKVWKKGKWISKC